MKKILTAMLLLTCSALVNAQELVDEVIVIGIDVVGDGSIAVEHTSTSCGGITSVRAWISSGAQNADELYSLILTAFTTGTPISYWTPTCTPEDNTMSRAASRKEY